MYGKARMTDAAQYPGRRSRIQMRKKGYVEMRYYDVPQKEWVLALTGDKWKRKYGEGIPYLHIHNLCEVGLCRYGTGELILDKKVCPFGPDMISVIPASFPHTTNSTEGTKGYWEYLFFDPRTILTEAYEGDPVRIARCMKTLSAGAMFDTFGKYPHLAKLADIVLDEMKNRKEFYLERVHAIMTAFVFELLRLCGQDRGELIRQEENMLMKSALAYMDKNFASQIRIKDLARECSISETHFRRLFSESFDVSPAEYLSMVRVLKACERMKKLDEPMSVVAMKCGFSTISTFDRNFKNVLGITPYQWKKNPDNFESHLLTVNIAVKKGW